MKLPEEIICSVSEIGSAIGSQVYVDPEKIAEITKDDSDPQFVTVYVEEGWSKNKRYWPGQLFDKIARQINENQPVAYLGHIKEQDVGYAFPDPQTVWLGAKVERLGEKCKLWVKGYNIPGARIRELVKRRAADSVSWRGDATLIPITGGYRVEDFEIESFDWARKGTSGMSAKLASVTSEMEDNVEPKDIAALSETELRTHNPLLVKAIEDSAVKPVNDKVTEMEAAATAVKPDLDVLEQIREKLGIDKDKNVFEAVAEVVDKLTTFTKDKFKNAMDDLLAKKIPHSEHARNAVKRLVGEIKVNADPEVDFPAYEKELETEFDRILNEDVTVQAVLAEMKVGDEGGARMKNSTSVAEMKTGGENSKKENENIVEEEILVP